jgi:hypothetical protein
MGSSQILEILAANPGTYVLDEIGTGEIAVKNADGSDVRVTDDYGRSVPARVPYAVFEPLIQQGYVSREQHSRIYKISEAGARAAGS